MTRNKIKNSGGAGAIRRWRSVAVAALVVETIGRSFAWKARGDERPGQVGSFTRKFVTHVTAMSAAVASVAVEAGRRPHVSTLGRSVIGRRAERLDVIT
ncbi:MAG TPA: hypothetical protein VGX28_08045 [Frankiaceae bacterium]|jgi:hypothetical protein|nr:hypothetical protein [Frankiaceae bacterium]